MTDKQGRINLVTADEFETQLGSGNTPEVVFMTALAMLLTERGGTFTYDQQQLDTYRALHGATGQLGITITGDEVMVFVYDTQAARA